MMSSATKDVIAIGGSSGSGKVLRQLLGSLPEDFRASLLVTTHLPTASSGYLVDMLADASSLPVVQAVDGQPVEPGIVYLAPADRHLLIQGGVVRLGLGPRENMSRPAIDPMFRSAALSCGPRVIGVVLTGLLNDGASGLAAIKRRGGTAVVQHPLDAEADGMPLAALQAVDVDHVTAAAGLGPLLTSLVNLPVGPAQPPPSDALRLEVEIAMGNRLGSDQLRQIADPSPLSCPDCAGVLSEIRGDRPLRYRCQIGHGYTGEVLVAHQEELEEAIRIAMRIMEERVTLVERMAVDARETGRAAVAELYEARTEEYRRYAATLRDAAIASLRSTPVTRDQDI